MEAHTKVYLFRDARDSVVIGKLLQAILKVSRNGAYYLEINGKLVSKSTGTGYDKESTVFAGWLSHYYKPRLQRQVMPITPEEKTTGLYGLIHLSQCGKVTKNVKRVPKAKRGDAEYFTFVKDSIGMESIYKIMSAIGINKVTLEETDYEK